jgi:hypothetical protein
MCDYKIGAIDVISFPLQQQQQLFHSTKSEVLCVRVKAGGFLRATLLSNYIALCPLQPSQPARVNHC